MKKTIFLILILFEIVYGENMYYKKAMIRHNSEKNGGYSQNGKIKYQYISGHVDVKSNRVDIASTRNNNKSHKITNNVYGNDIRMYGRSGYSKHFRQTSNIGTVHLNQRKNKRVQQVETYIDHLRIRKIR